MEKTCARIVCLEDIEKSINVSENFRKQFCSSKGVELEEVNVIARANGFLEENTKHYLCITDETGQVYVKLSDENQRFEIKNNDLLLVIGFLNFNGQTKYINPYIIKKIQTNENETENLRKLQIISFCNSIDKTREKYKKNKEKYNQISNQEKTRLEEKTKKKQAVNASPQNNNNSDIISKENLIKIIKQMDRDQKAVSYIDILDKFPQGKREEVETIIDALLDEGLCYEPIAGRIKVLE